MGRVPLEHVSLFPLWQVARVGLGVQEGWQAVGRVVVRPSLGSAGCRRPRHTLPHLRRHAEHIAALPRQRQLLHAAIYSEGHLLLSVVAKPSKDCMPRKIPPR